MGLSEFDLEMWNRRCIFRVCIAEGESLARGGRQTRSSDGRGRVREDSTCNDDENDAQDFRCCC